MANVMKANINDIDHPPDRTLWLGDLEPWMDDHYMVQVCSLFGWDTHTIYIPRPPAAPNATRHPNNAGYALFVFSSPSVAAQVIDQYGPDSLLNHGLTQPILLPNSNRPIKLDWLNSVAAKQSIGRDPGPIDNAIEYSIFVGDIASDVTNADLMNVFRNPNLGLRGDFPPRLIAPFLSCCNAKVMVDSVTGISKGYGFVRFTNETDQRRALVEMQGLYCKSRPMRLSTATAKNKATSAEDEHAETIPVVVKVPTPTVSSPTKGPISPRVIDPAKIRSITTAVAESAASRPVGGPSSQQQRVDAFSPTMIAKIAQLSNTMGQHYPAYRSGGPFLPPPGLSNAQIHQWLVANPQAKTHLETVLGGSETTSPGGSESALGGGGGSAAGGGGSVAPSDPMNTTVFVVPAAQNAAQAAAAAAAAQQAANPNHAGGHQQLPHARSTPSMHAQGHPHQTNTVAAAASADGPLSSEQALSIVERLVPALMAAAGTNANHLGPPGPSSSNPTGPAPTGHGHGLYNIAPPGAPGSGVGAIGGGAPGQRGLQHRAPGPPPLSMNNYRDAYSYPNGPSIPSPFVPPSPSPYSHRNQMGGMEYGRNDFYYDSPLPPVNGGVPAYATGVPYSSPPPGGLYGPNVGGSNAPYLGMGASMSPAVSQLPIGSGGYGAPAGTPSVGSVLEDQLLGTYGGGIQRLHNPSLRQGGGNGGVTASTYGGAYGPVGGGMNTPYVGMGMGMGGVGAGGAGGNYGADYDLDLGLGAGAGYRSGGMASGSFSSPGAFGPHAFGNGDLADRFIGTPGAGRLPYAAVGSGAGMGMGINGYGDGGMPNGFTFSPGFMPSGGMTGGNGGGGSSSSGHGEGTSPYAFGEDGSPPHAHPSHHHHHHHLQTADILRQDAGATAGLGSYLATTPGSSANPSAS
ncbi:RRM protein, partial [Serendipita sp. 399]